MSATDDTPMSADTVWIEAIPLPFLGWRTDKCFCGEKFKGKNRRARYEAHYRETHVTDDGDVWVEVPLVRVGDTAA